jgi:succinate dehydrogenase / fumarate reductase, cytochrome b subunit
MEKDRKEGIRGMANPGRYGIERVAYWLMRITGLGLLFYFIGHIYETSNLLDGKAAWNSMLELTQTTEGHIFLTLVIGMCVFHTGNGIRLMIGQAGFGIGKPARADYPYTPKSLNMKGKLCIYVSIGLAALAMMYGLGVMYDV